MVNYVYIISMLVLAFNCLTYANVDLKSNKNITKPGQKRIDVQVSKWREAQSAINSLIDQSISNEVLKAKKEVKALLERNIAKHLHEASRKVMQGNLEIGESETYNDHDDETAQDDAVCQDQFDNCATLAQSGVCETSKDAMKKHCQRTCELCDDDDFPPPAVSKEKHGEDTWTIIGTDGRKFTTNGGIQQGTRKASITTAQVERLLDYVKHNAPHLQLKKIKPGVLKLIRVSDTKPPEVDKLKKPEEKHTEHEDVDHDNYWSIKENNEQDKVKEPSKGPLIHFDLSSILKDKPGYLNEKELQPSVNTIHHSEKPKSEEYLKHICHPMCKKTCISSCAPGCCAGEHQHDFPLYHRKSSHCHPFCKKHCISSCPLTCCAETRVTSKTWHHPHIHHFTPGCHPMCKKNCVPSCPKACCASKPAKAIPKSHCHPLCKTNCLSSCPLSCCNRNDRMKETCHPLCRKTCLSSCPDECCTKERKEKKLIMKSKNKDKVKLPTTCHGLCPNSCAPACRSGCCERKQKEKAKHTPVTHITPSGCTANCVYECLPGCPPACCMKSPPATTKANDEVSSAIVPFTQPLMTSFDVPRQPQPVFSVYQPEVNQPVFNPFSQAPNFEAVAPRQLESTSLFAPKHCSSACLTHCSPECARSDCCDLDD